MSLKSQSNLRTNSLQYLENEPLNVLKLIVDRILWIEMIELAPSMWFGIVWKQARFWGHISASGKEMRHRSGISWLSWLMDVGRYEGVAPSMWAFAA